jgi:hypothetical protein
MDLQFDQTAAGRMFKILDVVDALTGEALACEVECSIDADGVVRCLDHLAANCGVPVYVCSDASPSSSPMSWSTGTGSPVPVPCSSTQTHRNRTPGSRASTVGSAMSASTTSC